jgi:hypothetical protein
MSRMTLKWSKALDLRLSDGLTGWSGVRAPCASHDAHWMKREEQMDGNASMLALSHAVWATIWNSDRLGDLNIGWCQVGVSFKDGTSLSKAGRRATDWDETFPLLNAAMHLPDHGPPGSGIFMTIGHDYWRLDYWRLNL